MSCIFCDIVSGTAPSSIVYQDKVCSAFMDIQPVNAGHVLVVPNAHATYLIDLPPETGAHMFKVAQQVSLAVRGSSIHCEGVNLFLADGEVAGQEVFHVHLHVIPRYRGDGFGFRFGPNYGRQPPRARLDEIATEIQVQLRTLPDALASG
jgi:histidine triad (HIT) family protein